LTTGLAFDHEDKEEWCGIYGARRDWLDTSSVVYNERLLGALVLQWLVTRIVMLD